MYKVDKKGRVRVWDCEMNEVDGIVSIVSFSGLEDGKIKQSSKQVKGKNIGRANETTPVEQAYAEMVSMRNKKFQDGYRLSREDAFNVPPLPMLATDYEDVKESLPFPLFVQPKLDGVRCFAIKKDGVVRMYSRNGIEFLTVAHIAEELNPLMSDDGILDGEIYVHGWGFSRILSAVKKKKEDSDKLQFWVYDVPMDDTDCETRMAILQNAFALPKLGHVRYTFTDVIEDQESIEVWKQEAERQGFEGVVLRVMDAPYCFNFRSSDLIKYKSMYREEFPVVGHEVYRVDVDGVPMEQVKWICRTEEGKDFTVVPEGSFEDRNTLLLSADASLGKNLIVQFQEYTNDNIPRFPVGKGFRDYE